jgi:hypothetical protein
MDWRIAVMSPTALAGSPAVREIVRDLRRGYTLEPDGKSHFKLIKNGELVRNEDGTPVTIPSTTRRGSTLHRLRENLQSVGALDERTLPKRTGKTKRKDEQLQAERADAQVRGTRKVRHTDELRARLEPLLSRAGEIRTTDLARVASFVNSKWTMDSAMTTVSYYLAGKALSDGEVERMMPLVERLEKAPSARAEWFMLLRETLGLDQPELHGGREWPFTVKLVPLEKIFSHWVDDGGYQRPVEENFVRELVLRFDERLVGTIDVSERHDGTFAVIDGQQRSEAMRRIGKTNCYASVYEELSLADEATLFFHKNRDRKPIHPYYEFMARVAAVDPVVLDIKRIVEQQGFQVATQGGAGLPQYSGERDRNITAIKALEEVYGYETDLRPECLTPVLGVIFRNWFGRRDSLSVHLIKGLGRFFRMWGDGDIQWEHWEEQLTALGPTLVLGMADDIHAYPRAKGTTRPIGVSLALVEIHNRGLPRGQRLDPRLVSSWRQVVKPGWRS